MEENTGAINLWSYAVGNQESLTKTYGSKNKIFK